MSGKYPDFWIFVAFLLSDYTMSCLKPDLYFFGGKNRAPMFKIDRKYSTDADESENSKDSKILF